MLRIGFRDKCEAYGGGCALEGQVVIANNRHKCQGVRKCFLRVRVGTKKKFEIVDLPAERDWVQC